MYEFWKVRNAKLSWFKYTFFALTAHLFKRKYMCTYEQAYGHRQHYKPRKPYFAENWIRKNLSRNLFTYTLSRVNSIQNTPYFTLSWSINIQIEAILVLVLQVRQQSFQILQPPTGHLFQRGGFVGNVRNPLRAHRTESVRDLNTRPHSPRNGGHKPQTAQRWTRVGNSPEHFNRLEMFRIGGNYDTAYIAVFCTHSPRS